jgi:hypothetical protein
MSRITLRVGLSRSSRLPISSLGAPPLYYLVPPPFSSSVGERELMNHFVVKKSFVKHCASCVNFSTAERTETMRLDTRRSLIYSATTWTLVLLTGQMFHEAEC